MFFKDILSIAEMRKDLDVLDVAHDSIVYIRPPEEQAGNWAYNRLVSQDRQSQHRQRRDKQVR